MKIRLPHKFILVTPLKTEETIGNNFVVSDKVSKNRYTRAKVDYTSENKEVRLEPGDTITYDSVAGKDFYAQDGKTYKVLRWEDVLTIEDD